jgi:hypothetical protein
MNADSHPDRLRQALRQGDPAADEPGLTPAEAQAMRRTVLTAAPEPRRLTAWFPLVAAGAAALLALALGVTFGPWHRPPVSPAKVQVAAVPSHAATPFVPPATAPPPQVPKKRSRPAHRRPVPAPKVLPDQEPPILTASLPVREIQFSTPGGTRVIWELATKDVR